MPVERLSRTQRDLQRLDGRRGPRGKRAVTWDDLDALLAEIAARSKASGGKFTTAIGATDGLTFDDLVGDTNIPITDIDSPFIAAPGGLTITSSVNEETGISYVYFDWDDVAGASGYQLGIILEGGGEFTVSAPTSFFQNSVIAGQTIQARVRSINALNVPGPWSSYVNHVAQGDSVPPEIPGNVTIEAAFNGFWFKWDKSNAVDISRYEVFESASSSPAPTALTNPTFTSASPLFFRGAVGNGITRHYWIRSVDYSENASGWSTRVSATTLRIDEDDLGDNVIVARHLTTGELITLSAQIRNAIISDAKIANLSAAKLIAGTQIANSILVNGQALGTVQQNANDPAARINAAATNIEPGKITLTGPATLLDWTADADRTRIDGGRIFTNSIQADAIDVDVLTADAAFITNLVSQGTSFMNQLLVREANIDTASVTTLKLGGNAATAASFGVMSGTRLGAGLSSAQSTATVSISIPRGVTARVLTLTSFSQGYGGQGEKDWGFTLKRAFLSATPVTLLSRIGMSARADYPTVARLETVTNTDNVSTSRLYTSQMDWYGEDAFIELQALNIAVLALWR